MVTRRRNPFRPRAAPLAPPRGFPGSLPEWYVFRELTETHRLREGYDFTFQASRFGGRLRLGGIVIDFLFFRPPGLGFSVIGEYFHYELRGGTTGKDVLDRNRLASRGIRVIFLDESDILRNARFYVAEGLKFRDHSYLSRR